VNRVHVLDLKGLTLEMRHDLAERLRMVYTVDDGISSEMRLDVVDTLCFQLGGAKRSMTWRQIILTLGLHTVEEMAEDGFEAYWLGTAPSYTYIRDSLRRLCQRLISYSISGRGQAPEKVTATDLFYLRSMDWGTTNIMYLFRHTKGKKSGARLSGGHFIRRLAHHFGMVSDDGLRGLSIMTRELLLIDMGELVKLNICMEVGDDWAWVAQGAERQPVAAVTAPMGAEDAPDVDEGAQTIPAPIHAPPLLPLADVRSLRGLMERLMIDQGRFSTWMISCMTQLMEASGHTYQAFDGTFRGSYLVVFERRTKQRTDGASTSTA
ncbi:hypothetical protein Tco_1462365, partial [Tanacetum coccineum]